MNHVEFEMLDGQGAIVSLALGDVEYIKRNGTLLVPDDQTTLWFNATSPAGSYIFDVKTSAGKVYRAVLDWTP
ncbi:hypothetical protein MKY59_21005 [Paenibacillus sp. FSL W8-0426]|uniref:hypothetical protein n=1 Tax=Paenibacillus sp. FSL W8-0426 TaxID=2921714 RepID=UPI0030D71883